MNTLDRSEWDKGRVGELGFWRNFLNNKSKKYLINRLLHPRLHFMLGDKKEVSIADIGAGAISIIGNTYEGVKLNITPSDFLADEYKQLLNELNIHPLIYTEKQDMEKLTYDNNTFDIVYCQNALDHCFDPKKAILEMIRICKSNGWIYFRHFPHVAKHHRYRNFHQWNIDKTNNNDCVVWNRQEQFLLSSLASGFNTETETGRIGMVVTTGKKENLKEVS